MCKLLVEICEKKASYLTLMKLFISHDKSHAVIVFSASGSTPFNLLISCVAARNPPSMAGDLEAKVLELSHMLQSKQAEVDQLKSELEEAEKVRKTTSER
jgi:hypothetical protein